MAQDRFYISNSMTVTLESMINRLDSLEDFEKMFPSEFLANDDHVGNYLAELLWKYDKKASVISQEAMLTHSYVGNIVNGKKRNPSRDALISICLAIGTTIEEVQYLLRYAGQAPLYVRRKRDVVIWFGFMKQMSLDIVNEKLCERGFKPLIKNP
jgi:transcriptional regulator with XRE-family HTH domain